MFLGCVYIAVIQVELVLLLIRELFEAHLIIEALPLHLHLEVLIRVKEGLEGDSV